jgi:hypothetical protein
VPIDAWSGNDSTHNNHKDGLSAAILLQNKKNLLEEK